MAASSHRAGLEKIFRGILNYRQKHKTEMVQQFVKFQDNPNPAAVFFTCMDSRLLPTKFTSTNVGDMFVVRNAGNMVPHSSKLSVDTTKVSTEAAALELGCVMNNIKHVVVCGHSDCKAINLLHSMRDNFDESGQALIPDSDPSLINSPLRRWMREHGTQALKRFNELKSHSFLQPMMLQLESKVKIPAYIDKDYQFNDCDKLSQINTLVQMENIYSFPFMDSCIKNGSARMHAFWFDIHSGDVYYFSRRKQHFDCITEKNVDSLLDELGDKIGTSADVAGILNVVEKANKEAIDCNRDKR